MPAPPDAHSRRRTSTGRHAAEGVYGAASCRSEPLGCQPGLDLVSHDARLVLEFLEKLVILVVTGPAGLEEEILGLVPPRLQPIRTCRETPVKQFQESVERIGGG